LILKAGCIGEVTLYGGTGAGRGIIRLAVDVGARFAQQAGDERQQK
jgi:hypothetical protein